MCVYIVVNDSLIILFSNDNNGNELNYNDNNNNNHNNNDNSNNLIMIIRYAVFQLSGGPKISVTGEWLFYLQV